MTEASEVIQAEATGRDIVPVHRAEVPAMRPAPISLLPVEQMKVVLDEWTDRRKAFRDWLKTQLREGIHYGYPPGCQARTNAAGEVIDDKGYVIPPEQWQHKPSLYQAGAELLCDLLKMRPRFKADTALWEMLGKPAKTVCCRCELINDGSPFFPTAEIGAVLGEGAGAAVAGEKRRDANSSIKVSQKSSLVDAVKRTLGLSDLYAQDAPGPKGEREEPRGGVGGVTETLTGKAPEPRPAPELATPERIGEFWELATMKKLPQEKVDAWLQQIRVTKLEDVSASDLKRAMERLSKLP